MATRLQLTGRRRAPGVSINRVAGQPRSAGVSISDVGMIGISKKGPVNKRVLCPDYDTYEKRFGKIYNNNYLTPSVKAHFDSGGGTLHAVRIVGAGAAAATAYMKAHDNSTATVLVDALDKGGGFLVEVDTLKAQAKITGAVTSGTVAWVFDSVNGFEVGDLVNLGGTASGSVNAFIQSINTSNKTATVLMPVMSGTFASGTDVYTATRHRTKTSLTQDYASGSASIKVNSSATMFQGQRLYISNTSTHGTSVVKAVNGSTVLLSAPMAVNITATSSFVVSNEFNLQVYEDGILVENQEFLSMEDESVAPNTIEHIEVKLSGDNNQSIFVKLTDSDGEDSLTAPAHLTGFESIMAIPITFSRLSLAGGSDGATPAASDWIGVDTTGSETGLYLFNDTADVRWLAMPGQSDVTACRAGLDYCESHSTKGQCDFVVDMPLASDLLDEALAFRNVTLARSTAFGVLVYPWVYSTHPEVSNTSLTLPPSPFFLGRASAVASSIGLRQAPAGVEDGKLPASVIGLTHTITPPEAGLLEEAGIVPILFIPRFGYSFQGAKTLSAVYNGFEWIPTQAMYNYIAASAAEVAKPFVFKPNNEDTRAKLQTTMQNFLKGMHDNGEFTPTDDPTRAFFVKCDDENNPQDVVDSGNLVCEIGFNAPTPAVFINFAIGRYNGKVTLTQSSV